MVQTLILHLGENGKTTVQLSNHSSESWKIHEGEMMGCLDMRSSGYFHVSRETLQQILQSSFKDNCSFLSERETEEYFDLYHKDHKEVKNYVSTQVNTKTYNYNKEILRLLIEMSLMMITRSYQR